MTLTQSLPLVAATCGARSVAVSGTLRSLGGAPPAEVTPRVRNCETTAAAATSYRTPVIFLQPCSTSWRPWAANTTGVPPFTGKDSGLENSAAETPVPPMYGMPTFCRTGM